MSETCSSKESFSCIKKNNYKPTLLELYKQASRTDILLLMFAILLAFILSSLPVILIIELGEVMKSIQDNKEDREELYEEQQKTAIIMLCLGALSVLIGWASVICLLKLANKLSMNYRNKYFSIIVNKPIKWFDKHNPAELGSVIIKDCDVIEKAVGEKFLIAVTAITIFFMSWITGFVINYRLSLFALIILPMQIVSMIIINISNQKEAKLFQEQYASSAGIAEENIEGAKTIAACNAQQFKSQCFQQEFEPLRRPRAWLSAAMGFGVGLIHFIIFASTGIFFYIGAYSLSNHNILGFSTSANAIDAIVVFALTILNTNTIAGALPALLSFGLGRQTAGKINQLILNNKKHDGDLKVDSIKGSIELNEVYFNYPSSPNLFILKGVSFKVKPGKSLALVGETGSGKSTIIQLIIGFYYVESGSLKIDKIDIKHYDLKSLRNFISLVSQEPMVFNYSIKENIRMGNPSATDKDVQNAAIQAEALEFILGLPEKFDTMVGVKGCQISGGQKQRLAIARAILKSPKILLLDEATSALDVKTEKKIQIALNKVKEGKATVIAAQRLSTIKKADTIAVLEEGQITETGSFEELMSRKGAFFKLFSGEIKEKSKNEEEIKELSISSTSLIESETSQQRREIKVKNIKRLFQIFTSNWGWVFLVIVNAILAGATFPFYGYYYAENTLSLLIYSSNSAENSCKNNILPLFVIGTIALFSITLSYFSITKISISYSSKLRYQVMSALLYFDQDFFDSPGNTPASLTCKLTSNCDSVSKLGGLTLLLQLTSIASIVIGIIISMMYNVLLSLIVIGFIPVMLYVYIKNKVIEKNGMAPKNQILTAEIISESMTNIKTVHSLNQQEAFKQNFMQASQLENEGTKRILFLNALLFGFRLSFVFSLRAILAWFGAYLVKNDKISLEEFLVVFYDLSFATWSFNFLGFFAADIEGGLKSADELLEIIDSVPKINAKSEDGINSNILGKVEFENVSFSYASRNIQVLTQVSFKIEAGQRLGITGTTGSGKSTIAQLMLRFYNPSSGSILIDGIRIEEYNIKYLRECLAWVGQEPIIFKGSILENVKLGNPNISLVKVMEALRQAQALEIVERYGLDSDVGLKGNRLSGGQKQRICIARALAKSPKIMILDESTSALDSITENLLQEEIKLKNYTIIAISHRLNTIQEFDYIAVIEKGCVVEIGSHNKLLAINNGVYQDLIVSNTS